MQAAPGGYGASGLRGNGRRPASFIARQAGHALGVGQHPAQQPHLAHVQVGAQEHTPQLAHGRLGRPALVEIDLVQGLAQLREQALEFGVGRRRVARRGDSRGRLPC